MISKIAVLGAGTMGHSVAGAFARFGMDVNLYDPYPEVLPKAVESIKAELSQLADEGIMPREDLEKAFASIHTFSELKDAVKDRDFVFEAGPEKVELKQNIFFDLVNICPSHTLFGTNTSSLKLEDITSKLTDKQKERVFICHMFNPPHIIPVVEISHFEGTNEEHFQEIYNMWTSIKKKPVKVLKDVPGMVANRLQHALLREAFSLIEHGIAYPEDVDNAVQYGAFFRFVATGVIWAADMGGLDVWYPVCENTFPHLEDSKHASPLLKEKVEAGKYGIKSGEGFYKYPDDEIPAIREKFNKNLLMQLKTSEQY